VAHDRLEVFQILRALEVSVAVLDVEPLVSRWGQSDLALSAGLRAVIDSCEAIDTLHAIVFMTNSGRRPSTPPASSRLAVQYIPLAGKPSPGLEFLEGKVTPAAVCGDQPLTDGLLAWRIRGIFVELRVDEPKPYWIRIQRMLGHSIEHFLFFTPALPLGRGMSVKGRPGLRTPAPVELPDAVATRRGTPT
jgi:hypothetical protein